MILSWLTWFDTVAEAVTAATAEVGAAVAVGEVAVVSVSNKCSTF